MSTNELELDILDKYTRRLHERTVRRVMTALRFHSSSSLLNKPVGFVLLAFLFFCRYRVRLVLEEEKEGKRDAEVPG